MANAEVQDAAHKSLDEQLVALADKIELIDLVSRLGAWLDDKDFETAATLLTEDVTVRTTGGAADGIVAVTEQARRTHAHSTTQHLITNVLVDLAGDDASMRANLIVTFVPRSADAPPQRTLGERYRFGSRRTAAGWRLCRIEIDPVWTTLQPEPPPVD